VIQPLITRDEGWTIT